MIIFSEGFLSVCYINGRWRVQFIKLKLIFYVTEFRHFLEVDPSFIRINCGAYKNVTFENRFASGSEDEKSILLSEKSFKTHKFNCLF